MMDWFDLLFGIILFSVVVLSFEFGVSEGSAPVVYAGCSPWETHVYLSRGNFWRTAWENASFERRLAALNASFEKSLVPDFILEAQDFAESHSNWYCSNRSGCGNHSFYNCMNFSRDLVAELRAKGFDAIAVVGSIPSSLLEQPNNLSSNESRHAWVRVTIDVEPQNGRATNFSMARDVVEIYSLNYI